MMDAEEHSMGMPCDRVVHGRCEDEVIDAITQQLIKQSLQCVSQKQHFHLILSCADALESVYARMMYDPDLRAMPWENTHLWFLDGNVDEAIVMHSGILEENVHRSSVETSIVANPTLQFDCCVIDVHDIASLSPRIYSHCAAFLILSDDQDIKEPETSAVQSSELGSTGQGVAHWFTTSKSQEINEPEDLHVENP